ncbi:MAG: ATP-dependent DNA helicase RecG, partial [Candidatus Eisenbacteria bacterium]|nr:ATP-dependent DNA helicase RecG [Candidatus Eisenbacteria bacterium]
FGGGRRKNHFTEGAKILVSGKLGHFRGRPQFQNPEYEPLDELEDAEKHTGLWFPIYPLTRGVSQHNIRDWVRQALAIAHRDLEDTLPPGLIQEFKFTDLLSAYKSIHFPASQEDYEEARRRLVFDELFLDQLFMGAVRRRREKGKRGPKLVAEGEIFRRVRAGLPFTLTGDQDEALNDIMKDVTGGHPMNRLLQGDVGSGKTVVALLAAGAAADAGKQTALMAPTEILAEQHYRNIIDMAGAFGLEPRLLTGSTKAKARKEILRTVKDGSCPLLVGTHALFQEQVEFFDLGLVVVDEQHRFGVMQRLALTQKGQKKGVAPHVLVMSATPIPRSLALTRYGDLDLTIIKEKPAGRGRIISRLTSELKREAVYGFLAERLREGRQAFVIYPLVEESAKSDMKSATEMAARLQAHPKLEDFGVALLHGQMKPEDKDATMKAFSAGDHDVLVATTVVEVGIDVPNASFMVIEHPERYGLSQLHQLRGRIGRGKHTSYCVLIIGPQVDAQAQSRLEQFVATDDGFELARIDLQLRGQGDMAGTRQSGRPAYRLADPIRDEATVETARVKAQEILSSGALDGQAGPEWEPLAKRLRGLLEQVGALAEAG